MARRSTRIASSQGSQASSSPPAPNASSPQKTAKKRKAGPGDSPSAKRGKKESKEQKTIEESMDIDNDENAPETEEKGESKAEQLKQPEEKQEPEKKSDAEQSNGHSNGQAQPEADAEKDPSKELGQEAGEESAAPDNAQKQAESGKEQDSKTQAAENKSGESQEEEQSKSEEMKPATNGGNDNAVEEGARDEKVPSSILEKGIIYFFFRGRVNVEDPKNVQDLQRSFFVMRPLSTGAKIGDGTIGDEKNCRLIAIPKKMLPLSGNDRWTAFVETANTSFKDLKESFLKSDEYETQTGPRTTPAATPVAEGVYAITSTGRESHLAYILTLPEKLGDIQSDLGLRQKGSFVVSVKNPKAPGPSNADLGKDPGYSQEILNTFRGLRWSPLQPEMMNYEACQFLLIGEGEKGLDKATETQPGDEKKDETAKEEIEKLEDEDETRVEHLNGEDAVFADLGTNAKDYNGLQTTW